MQHFQSDTPKCAHNTDNCIGYILRKHIFLFSSTGLFLGCVNKLLNEWFSSDRQYSGSEPKSTKFMHASVCVRWAPCVSSADHISFPGLCFHRFPIHSALCFEVAPPVQTFQGNPQMFWKIKENPPQIRGQKFAFSHFVSKLPIFLAKTVWIWDVSGLWGSKRVEVFSDQAL